MKIVTSGLPYIDIDAYAGCIAYAELLNLTGEQGIAASSAVLNESITKTLLSWGAPLVQDYTPDANDEYVMIDLSDPDHFDSFVTVDKVTWVFDHHPGFEEFWSKRIGGAAHIETLGAACTQVYEAWVEAGKADEISQISARLLIAGILDNTLNFKAGVTTNRDKQAYKQLMQKANTTESFTADYFNECQTAIEANLEQAIKNDLKKFPQYPGMPSVLAQLVIWDSEQLLTNKRVEIQQILNTLYDDWAINIADINAGKSYFLATSSAGQKLNKLLGLSFTDGLAVADRLWLRKEILKLSLAN